MASFEISAATWSNPLEGSLFRNSLSWHLHVAELHPGNDDQSFSSALLISPGNCFSAASTVPSNSTSASKNSTNVHPTDCGRITAHSESAGLNRHIVGGASPLQERK